MGKKQMNIKQKHPGLLFKKEWNPPRVFNAGKPKELKQLHALIENGPVKSIHDEIHMALDDLFDIKFPEKKDSKSPQEVQAFVDKVTKGNPDEYGRWVFYPWSGELVHFPSKDDLRALRTSRNRNLITAKEQRKLYKSTVLVIGMSVGSNVVEALVSQGIGGKLILADMDVLDPSNLNRIRARFEDTGTPKVDVVAKKVSEIDPYIEQVHYHDGLTESNLQEILRRHKPDVIIDEMDNVTMKLKLRLSARRHRVPVIMAADDGDNILLDVERYDLHKRLPILHGKIPQEVIESLLSGHSLTRQQLGMLIGKYFVGFENTPLRMFQSLGEVGKTLPSWPQLGGAAALAGITLAYCTKKIILNQLLSEGRFVVGPDAQLNPEIETIEYKLQISQFIDFQNKQEL